eukprot:TRINITY_DN9487_c1_g1_i2.p2 TRINITY_DN9487_c1_g1~~TRINITY_DN9487_c1_g1_i2.p2  ORF type:complete len:431 (-),score=123.81 TRINITY_DN9487_c1_g1_i2:215-1507(-)
MLMKNPNSPEILEKLGSRKINFHQFLYLWPELCLTQKFEFDKLQAEEYIPKNEFWNCFNGGGLGCDEGDDDFRFDDDGGDDGDDDLHFDIRSVQPIFVRKNDPNVKKPILLKEFKLEEISKFHKIRFRVKSLGVWGMKIWVVYYRDRIRIELEASGMLLIEPVSRNNLSSCEGGGGGECGGDGGGSDGYQDGGGGGVSVFGDDADITYLKVNDYEIWGKCEFESEDIFSSVPIPLLCGDRPLQSNFLQVIQTLHHGLVEREEACTLSFLGLVAGEHVFLYGPPGTGKSLIARRLSDLFLEDCRYFEVLLNSFTTPDEIFGPVSLLSLKKNDLHRVGRNFLPGAHVAFIDEIFKANKGVLHSMLTILNEREFFNGRNRESVPLLCCLSASNEVPTSSHMLALLDRSSPNCPSSSLPHLHTLSCSPLFPLGF